MMVVHDFAANNITASDYDRDYGNFTGVFGEAQVASRRSRRATRPEPRQDGDATDAGGEPARAPKLRIAGRDVTVRSLKPGLY